MKRRFVFSAVLIWCLLFSVPVFADTSQTDAAPSEQIESLQSAVDRAIERTQLGKQGSWLRDVVGFANVRGLTPDPDPDVDAAPQPWWSNVMSQALAATKH